MFWNPCWLYLKLQWLLELLPFSHIANVSLSFSLICGIVLPFLALFPLLLCLMDMSHQLCGILLSICQQLRCLVCCTPVSGWSVQRSPTVYLHCHFLAHSLVCVHTTWLHLKIHIFCTFTLSCRHRRYSFFASILHSTTTWLIVSSLSLHNQCSGDVLCQFCFLRCLFSVLDLMQPLAFPLFLFFSNPLFSHFQVSWLLTSTVFLMNCKSNYFSMKFFRLFSRISFFVFLPPRILSSSTALNSLSLLFSAY